MPRLRLSNVGRTFGEDPPIVALKSVDLTIAQGDYVAIEGPSGSGKSTLLNLLTLMDLPTAGVYEIDRQSAGSLSEVERARMRSDTFGFIFQSFHLMPRRTACENVEVGLLYRGVPAGERRKLALEALARVGLSERSNVAAQKLSGGERQRVAIARATLGTAPVVVADEPTGNLDSANSEAIVGLLGTLNTAGTTVVIVTHDPSVAAHARRHLTMRDGTIVEDRKVDALPSDPAQASLVPGRPSRLRLVDILRESWRGLRGRPGRFALLAAAVGIAVGLVVATLGLSQTATAQVSSRFDVLRNREVSVSVPLRQQLGEVSAQVSDVPVDVETRLARVRGVRQSGVLESYEPAVAGVPGLPSDPSVTIAGVSPGLLATVDADVQWAPGHSHLLDRQEVLLGTYTADVLGVGPLDLDPVIAIDGVDYTVAGVIETSRRAPQLAASIVVNWRYAKGIGQLDSSTVYLTTVGGAAPQVAKQAPLAIDPDVADLMQVQTPPDPASLRGTIQSDVRVALLALSAVAFLASIVGVANAMLLSVIERIGELGLRRALGARRSHILGQTSVEAILAGGIGGVLGLLAGMITVLAVTIANHWQPVLDLRLVPLALLGGALVGIIGGLPASVRASRLQPADALRR